jgi:hypothetical protein
MSREEKLTEFVGWAQHHITGDEKGQAQIFLDRLFQAFGHPGVLDVGGQTKFRIRKASADGGTTPLKQGSNDNQSRLRVRSAPAVFWQRGACRRPYARRR